MCSRWWSRGLRCRPPSGSSDSSWLLLQGDYTLSGSTIQNFISAPSMSIFAPVFVIRIPPSVIPNSSSSSPTLLRHPQLFFVIPNSSSSSPRKRGSMVRAMLSGFPLSWERQGWGLGMTDWGQGGQREITRFPKGHVKPCPYGT